MPSISSKYISNMQARTNVQSSSNVQASTSVQVSSNMQSRSKIAAHLSNTKTSSAKTSNTKTCNTKTRSALHGESNTSKFTLAFVLKSLVFGALVAVLAAVMHLLLAQPSTVNVLLNDVKSDKNVDTLVLGDSYAEVGLTPQIITQYCGGTTVNLARMTTIPERFYYLTKTANKDGQIKRVILEMSPPCWVGSMSFSSGTDNNGLFQDLTLETKAEYLINECLDKKFTNVIFDFNIGTDTAARVPKALPIKLGQPYIQKQDAVIEDINRCLQLDKYYGYGGYGQRRGEKYDPDYNKRFTIRHWDFSQQNLNQTTMRAFDNLVNYCKENNIELVCIETAKTPYHLSQENYDAVHDFFTQLCASHGVTFYDLNYIKKEVFPRTDADYVDVDGHMFGSTADRQSELVGELITGQLKDEQNNALFYNNYDEVLQNICFDSKASCSLNKKE